MFCCLHSPTTLFFSLSLIFFYLSFVCEFLCLHSKIVIVCLDIIFLIPGLFHESGSSFESHYFNAGENKVVWRSVEIPLWWQSPKSNNSTVSSKKYQVSHSIAMVKSIRNWSSPTEISTLSTYGLKGLIKQTTVFSAWRHRSNWLRDAAFKYFCWIILRICLIS